MPPAGFAEWFEVAKQIFSLLDEARERRKPPPLHKRFAGVLIQARNVASKGYAGMKVK
jgi:hypothetical protein